MAEDENNIKINICWGESASWQQNRGQGRMAIKNKFNNFLSQIYDKGLAKSDEGQVLVMSIIMFYECKNMKIIILYLIYFWILGPMYEVGSLIMVLR